MSRQIPAINASCRQ